MKILFNAFLGTAPKFDDEQVPDGYATVSHNTKSERGILEPWAMPVSLGQYGRSNAKSMFKYRNEWFSWPQVTYAVKAPLKNDAYDFVVIASKDTDPQVAYNLDAEEGGGPYPAASYPLNVPVPLSIVGVTTGDAEKWVSEAVANGDGGEEMPPDFEEGTDSNGDGIIGVRPFTDPEVSEYDLSEVVYAICYVDAWGRLSALSAPTDLVTIREWEYINTTAVTLTLPDVPDSLLSADPLRKTTAKTRIYRTNLGTSGKSVFQFVAEIPSTQLTYVDSAYSGDLLDAPINEDWVGAPDTNAALFPSGAMEKIAVMGADILVGHNKRILCFAEPEAFYAWPVKYYKVFQEDIVTIQPSGSNLVVLTTGVPYIIQGVHPESMDAARLADPVPCSSPHGSTEVAGAVYFASEVGLFRIESYSMANVSTGFIESDEWRALDPSTMRLANSDNKVFVHCPTVGKTFVFDAIDPNAGIRTVDISAESFVELEETNDLAYIDTDSRELMLFDSSSDAVMPVEWTSKTYVFNDPTCFNIAKVRANQYPVRLRVEYDHALTGEIVSYTKEVASPTFFYLPFNSRAFRWRVGVDPISQAVPLEIRDIQLAQAPEELV